MSLLQVQQHKNDNTSNDSSCCSSSANRSNFSVNLNIKSFESRYSRIDQVKFVEANF